VSLTLAQLTLAQLTGREQGHLVTCAGGHLLHPAAAEALEILQDKARQAGFDLVVASSFRSYDRQLAIFNGKASGERPVHDDLGEPVAMDRLSPDQQLAAILRFSALPGTSRHHWGTDLDVYDAVAAGSAYQVQLTPAEVAPGGLFDAFHCWLDDCIEAGESEGFFRPYNVDRGGVAPERWHLSYAPVSRRCAAPDADRLSALWRETGLLLLDAAEAQLEQLLERYVVIPEDWCPGE
jgi:LAS superfamily LD-carboxypeptidase LdcB